MAAITRLAGAGRLAVPALMAALLPASIPYPAFGAPADTPAEVVSAVVKLDNGRDWAPVFAVKPTALMVRYFTSAFNAAWVTAMTHNKDEPVLDGDPITGGQGVTGIALKSISAGPATGAKVTVVAHLAVRSEGETKAILQNVPFTLEKEGGTWKIDDIASAPGGTLRAYFRKSYGH